MKQASFKAAFPLAGLVVAVGLALRFWQIGDAGLWLDEAFSLWMGSQRLTEMAGWLARIDQHPPLYYALLHGWLAGGSGEGWVRAFSQCRRGRLRVTERQNLGACLKRRIIPDPLA